MSDVYAYDHGSLVERSLVCESVVDASELEVDLQGDIRIILGCLILIEFLVLAQEAHRPDAVVDVPEPLDFLVRARVVIRQDDQDKSYTRFLAGLERFHQSVFVPFADGRGPRLGRFGDHIFAKSVIEGFEKFAERWSEKLSVLLRAVWSSHNSQNSPVFQSRSSEHGFVSHIPATFTINDRGLGPFSIIDCWTLQEMTSDIGHFVLQRYAEGILP